MNSVTQEESRVLTPQNIFRFFKYSIYILLTYDGLLFFYGDLAASAVTFGDTVTWRNVIEAYSATFDTMAWVALLLLFELETAIIPDHLLKGWLKWVLKGLSGICYFFIIYSFYGYIYKYGVMTDLVPLNIDDVCSLIGTNFTYVLTLDEYLPLDQAVCTAMNGLPLMQINGTEIIGVEPAMADAIALAVRVKVPVFVSDSVMDRAGIVPEKGILESEGKESASKENLSAFRDFVDSLDLEDLLPE